jgi:hypothetical protein
MPRTSLRLWIVLLAAAVMTVVPAAAQDAQPPADRATPPEGRRGPARGGVTPQEITQMLNAVMLMRAQEALQLRDDQHAPFIKALRGFQATRQRLENQRNRLVRDLRMALQAPGTSETALAERLQALREHDAQAPAALRQAWDAVDQVLDVRQQARFRVLEQDIERQQLDLLMRARGAARGR